jgi:hypothetical protein
LVWLSGDAAKWYAGNEGNLRLADAETPKSEPTVLYRATVKTKDGRTETSQVAAVFGKKGQVSPDDQAGGLFMYRFKVRTADGKETASKAVPGARQKFVASELKWGDVSHDHGGETTMTAKVKYDGGRPVRFVVQHDHFGSWLPYAQVQAEVKDGVATGKLTVHHPVLKPGEQPDPAELDKVDPAHLRFKVEIGEAEPPPDPDTVAPEADEAAEGAEAKKDDGKFSASDHSWSNDENEHGSTTTISASVKNDNGQPVRFVVESNHDGQWQHYATVPGKVFEGTATADLNVHHPLLVPGRPLPTKGQLANSDVAKLRFRVELGSASPQPPPKKDVPALPKKPPLTDTHIPLKLKVQDSDGQPHVARPFEIHLDSGKIIKGITTAEGLVEAKVPRGAPAKLIVKGKDAVQTIQLALGKLELPTSVKGVQQRLLSLGYKLDVSGNLDAATKKAMAAFKIDHALPGAADIASLAKHIHAAYQGK